MKRNICKRCYPQGRNKDQQVNPRKIKIKPKAHLKYTLKEIVKKSKNKSKRIKEG
jgi:hypothetical protein